MYAATKGAITAFTKSISADLAPFGIRANCVAPGFIETDMTDALGEEVKEKIMDKVPLKRLGQPEDIANAVIFWLLITLPTAQVLLSMSMVVCSLTKNKKSLTSG